MTLHLVRLIFWNAGDRSRGAEVRTGHVSAPTPLQAADKVVRRYRDTTNRRRPDEIRVLRCHDDHVLWQESPVYINAAALDAALGDKWETVPVEGLLACAVREEAAHHPSRHVPEPHAERME